MSSEEKFNCQWIGQVIINHETQKGVRSKHASIAAVSQCRALIDAPLLLHASVTIWIHCCAGKQATAEPDLWHFRERPQRFWVFIFQPQASLNEELNFSLLQRTENHQKKNRNGYSSEREGSKTIRNCFLLFQQADCHDLPSHVAICGGAFPAPLHTHTSLSSRRRLPTTRVRPGATRALPLPRRDCNYNRQSDNGSRFGLVGLVVLFLHTSPTKR